MDPDKTKGQGETRSISFTIDGANYTVTDKHQSLASLLSLAGLPVGEFGLGEVRHGNVTRFNDTQTISVKDGDAFQSIKLRPQVG